jgi:hypothetical protein
VGLLIGLGAVAVVIVIVSIVAARRGTEQVTTYGDASVERERTRWGGAGGR